MGRPSFGDRQRLRDAPGTAARVRVLEKALHGRLSASRHAGDAGIEAVVREILLRRGSVSVTALGELAGLSERQLGRRFQAAVGLRPKTLCRIVRYQSILHALAAPRPPGWVALALDAGYFDQAHFIRDFRAFSGVPPQAYLDGSRWEEGRLAPRFRSRQRLDALFGLGD